MTDTIGHAALRAATILIVPGLYNSSAGHWPDIVGGSIAECAVRTAGALE